MNDTIRVAICDDLDSDRKLLFEMLSEYFTDNGLLAEIDSFSSGEELLKSDASLYSLVFFDIYMGDGMSGVDAARALKEKHSECVIIFTTTSREHGADAFDVDAFHYLVKPLDRNKLFSVLDKWFGMLCEVKTLSLKAGRTTREIFVRDILYIDVLVRSCTVHTATEAIENASSLSALEALLPAGEFIRPIRYCLVALRHIKRIDDEALILSNDVSLPFSRRERTNVRRQLAAYRLQKLRRR